MATTWFCLVAVMLAIYVLLDGFDFGAGAIQMLVARTPEERRQAIASIGPLWDGNEVWLLAAGGTLYFAFPALYASGFSGFYLPLMFVLWLLILPRHIRGIPPTTSRARCGFPCGILCFAFPACCCAYFLARRSATSFAA